jgi:RHS repeat-associated protein
MAYHDLAGGAAQRLLLGDYGAVLAGSSANAAASVARLGRVVRYRGAYEAVVRGAHGLRVERSTTPLEVGAGSGRRPVDLTLHAAGSAFVPVAPVTDLSIARDSAGGVAVGSSGLRVTLEGAAVMGRQATGQSVFFGSVGPDMDASVAPTIDGAELFAVLRSRLSPDEIRYRVELPVGATLEEHVGGAVISRGGVVMARVPAPDARDAQGSVVPVSMRVSGHDLVLSVSLRDREVAYPVLVDPIFKMSVEGSTGWTYKGGEGVAWTHGSSLSLGGKATFPLAGEVLSSEASLTAEMPKTFRFTMVEFLGVGGFIKALPNGEGWNGGVTWDMWACSEGESFGGSGELTWPSTITLGAGSCGSRPSLHMSLALGGAGSHEVTVSGEISVASLLLTFEPSALEEEEIEGEFFGEGEEAAPEDKLCMGGKYPVNCATGNQVETQTDLSVGGRGGGLRLTRTYNSKAAFEQGSEKAAAGPFGYGWSATDSAHLSMPISCVRANLCIPHGVDVYEENGSVLFFEGESSGPYTAANPLVQATLAKEGSSYVYVLPDQTKLTFNEAGRLTSRTDRNGNTISIKRNSEGLIESISDASGRKLTYEYNNEGQVYKVIDPMGHAVKYGYENGNLISVSQPGETSARWQFKYNTSHEMTEMTDGRGHAVTTEYNAAHQVTSQTDAMSRKRSWKYAVIAGGSETTITEPNGSETVEKFNGRALPTSVTHASGTSIAATTTYEYNSLDEPTVVTDPNKHKTEYSYDSSGNRTSEKNADGDEAKWTYDSKHDIETETTPDGETTTIKRNSAGDPEVIERPAPGSKTQKTAYKYDADGDVESMTNPLERTWKYEYDSYGDRKAETDPEGNKRAWEYNEDCQETAEVSPRGNAAGAKASEFTTKTERDPQGRPLKITDPLGHTTKYTYDGDGNVETVTDGNSHKTKYTYDADNELTKTEEPNKTVTETDYDSMGRVKSQTDGNKHVTKYVRNALEEIEEEVNPLGKKTLKEYDGAANLVKLTDPKKRTATYTYDPANRLTEVSYSSGSPAAIKYEYNKDDDRTKTIDGTGTTTYTYDQLDRMTESETGHKEVSKYEYNLGNQQTKITYPNTKTVERAYDKDGRLEKVTDWSANVTKFAYSADSELEKVVFPTASKDEDTYAYNDADQMTEAKMAKSTETLASLVYTRDNDGQVKKTTAKKLPGTEVTENTYDENNRLTKYGSVEYKYDAANNPTTEGSTTNTYNEGDELEKGTGIKYTYDELGERTKTTPEKGPATTYGYDQVGNLISAERPKEGETAEIKDTYAYNGEDLRTSQTIAGTTSYLAWDTTEGLPLVLSDGTNSYIYGPSDMPIEQISSGGTVTYMHHDQAGSTRLLTGSTGTVTGKCTYSAYGTPTCEGTTTPLGYDAQYTSTDTGLIYLRNRVYDPATAQFLSRDPLVALTEEPYSYTGDNPVNYGDPSGLVFGISGTPSWEEVGEGVAGWGDKLTFGLTKKIREGIGDENIDACSSAYQDGGYAGLATTFFVPGEDEVEGARLVEAGASDLSEQLALEEAQAGAGTRIMEGEIGDPDYPEDVWAKMQHVHENPGGSNIVIHYWENLESGLREGFKFK